MRARMCDAMNNLRNDDLLRPYVDARLKLKESEDTRTIWLSAPRAIEIFYSSSLDAKDWKNRRRCYTEKNDSIDTAILYLGGNN